MCAAVSYTPWVYSNQIGASNRFDYIVLRGFSDGSLDNVYLDGLKMMGDTNSHSSLVVDPWFLDNIEVVRGPASVLYGRSSPGGIVALTSRKPSFDAGGEVKLFAGNNNQRGAAFDVTGALDDNDRVAARLSGMTRYADSQFGPLKEERYALMPSLTWRITDQTRLDLMAYLHRDPEGGSHSGLPYDGTVVPHYGQKISNTFLRARMTTTNTIAARTWWATTLSTCSITAGRYAKSCAICILMSNSIRCMQRAG